MPPPLFPFFPPSQACPSPPPPPLPQVSGFEARLRDADTSADVRASADLLISHLHLCVKGAATVDIPAWDGSGDVRVALDPSKGALECAQALYKRAGKLGRTSEMVAPLLADAREEVEYLAQVDSTLAQVRPRAGVGGGSVRACTPLLISMAVHAFQAWP